MYEEFRASCPSKDKLRMLVEFTEPAKDGTEEADGVRSEELVLGKPWPPMPAVCKASIELLWDPGGWKSKEELFLMVSGFNELSRTVLQSESKEELLEPPPFRRASSAECLNDLIISAVVTFLADMDDW
jgi:hypothetical protein